MQTVAASAVSHIGPSGPGLAIIAITIAGEFATQRSSGHQREMEGRPGRQVAQRLDHRQNEEERDHGHAEEDGRSGGEQRRDAAEHPPEERDLDLAPATRAMSEIARASSRAGVRELIGGEGGGKSEGGEQARPGEHAEQQVSDDARQSERSDDLAEQPRTEQEESRARASVR